MGGGGGEAWEVLDGREVSGEGCDGWERDGLCVWEWRGVSLNFVFNDAATTEIYPLPLHDALPILRRLYFKQHHLLFQNHV